MATEGGLSDLRESLLWSRGDLWSQPPRLWMATMSARRPAFCRLLSASDWTGQGHQGRPRLPDTGIFDGETLAQPPHHPVCCGLRRPLLSPASCPLAVHRRQTCTLAEARAEQAPAPSLLLRCSLWGLGVCFLEDPRQQTHPAVVQVPQGQWHARRILCCDPRTWHRAGARRMLSRISELKRTPETA